MARDGWGALSDRFARLLSSRRRYQEGAQQRAPRILAIVPHGPDRMLLNAISQDSGWTLTVAETPPSPPFERQADVAPIVIYDREISPHHWREDVGALTRNSPRPYLILLSPNADTNLWDELQRLGGSDILHAPVTRDKLIAAVKRASQLWRSQQQLRSLSQNGPGRSTK